MDQTFFIYNMQRKKLMAQIHLCVYALIIFLSPFLALTNDRGMSHDFLIYFIIKILSPFSDILFAYMTLQLCITAVILMINVQMSVLLFL